MEHEGQSVSQSQEADSTYRKIAWRMIPFLIVCYFFAFLDRSNIAIAKLQFTKSITISEAAYGLGGGIFYLGYSLLEVPSNLLLARSGARKTMSRILILWSVFSAALAFMQNVGHFYILRFLVGCAEAGFFPGVLFYLSQWSPAARRARFTALFMSAMTLSGLIGNPISGWIMHSLNGTAGLKGWQWLFLIEGLPGVLLGVMALFCLTDRPDQASWLSDRQKAIVQSDLAIEAGAKIAKAHTTFRAALRDPRFYLLALMSVALFSAIGGVGLWLPSIVRKAGYTDVLQVGLISAIPYLVALVTQQLVARSSDRSGERLWHAITPALIGGAAWIILPFIHDQPMVSLALMCVATAGTFGGTGPFWSMPSTALAGSAAAGGIAVITTCGSAAAFVSPLIVGWATERTGSLDFGQFYFGSLLGIAALSLLMGAGGLRRSQAAGIVSAF